MNNFKAFLEHYRTKEIMLSESPVRLGRNYGEDLDNNWFNVESAKELISKKHNSLITKQNILSAELNLYRDEYSGIKFQDYWLTDQPFISCYFMFEQLSDNGLQALGVWNHKSFKGSARDILFIYYLKHYSYIISDNKHHDRGENYWKRIIEQGTKLGHKLTVITRSGSEFDIDDTEAYWGNSSEFSNYRIKIYAR
jgi:hypothetical protein